MADAEVNDAMFIFDWEIQNFLMSGHSCEEPVLSPVFNTPNSEVGLQVVCYPCNSHLQKNRVVCFLKRIKVDKKADEVRIIYSISTNDGFNTSETQIFELGAFGPKGFSCSPLYISPTGSIYIRCHIWSIAEHVKSYRPGNWRLNSESDAKPKLCSAVTRLITHTKSIFWPVKNFTSMGPDVTLSKTVKTGEHEEFFFHIAVRVQETYDGKIVSAEIRRKTHSKSMYVLATVKSIGSPKSMQLEGPAEYYFSKHENGPWNLEATLKMEELIQKSYLWCVEGTLYLCFDFRYSVVGEEVTFVNAADDPGLYIFESPESVQFCESAYQKHVTVRVADEVFLVDETVLTSKSTVFHAMFSCDFREKWSKHVDIKDLDPDTVRRVLVFLSVDQVDHMNYEDALNLYNAAAKYDLEMLTCKCRDIIISNFSTSNVCELVLFAEAYCDRELLLYARGFIIADMNLGFTAENWKKLKNNKDKVVKDIYRKIKADYLRRRKVGKLSDQNEDTGMLTLVGMNEFPQ